MNNTIQHKAPVTRGVAKVPVIMQMEALECGAACLAMVAAYYGKWVPLEQVRVDCGVSRDGSNARNVLVAARSYGLLAKGYRYEPESLRANGKFPCIIHWNMEHFVVLNGFKKDKAVLNDPARGTVSVSMEEFDRSFTGICLMMEPGPEFLPEGKPKSVLAFAKARLKGAGPAVVFVVLCTIISSLLGVIQPGFSRIFYDRLLTGQNPEWFYPFMIALAVFSGLEILISAVETLVNNRINAKFSVVGSSTFLWKLLHLPMEFYSQRLAGDLQMRQSSNEGVANSLVNTFAPLALNAVMMVFYLTVMIRYSWQMTLVGLATIAVNAGVSWYISQKRINLTRVQMRDSAKLNSATVSGIEMIETIKASGAENGFFARWTGYQASVNTQTVRFTRTNMLLTLIPSVLSTLCSCTITLMGVWYAMNGHFTVGMISAFQGYLSSFMAPATALISAGQGLQEMRTEMERIEDVMQYPDDAAVSFGPPEGTPPAVQKLSGEVELRNVTFGYSRLAEPLIRDLNLHLKPGSRVALVGASG